MIVTLTLIHFLGLMYIFTYLLPFISDSYNDNTYFFYHDVHKIEGLRQLPQVIKIGIMVVALTFYIIINISLTRAIYTPAGSIPTDREWDIREDVLTIFKKKNQLTENPLDLDIDRAFITQDDLKSTKKAMKYLEKSVNERYFGMNMSAIEVEHQLFNPPNSSWVIVKGVEENLALKFHKKYMELTKDKISDSPKSEKFTKARVYFEDKPQLEKISEHAKSEDNNDNENFEEHKRDEENNGEKDDEDSLITAGGELSDSKLTRDRNTLFPIFSKVYETKVDGSARIWIRCLKTKPDRCHHWSICNLCVKKMDHHCPWLNNCIGFSNYKYFFNTIFYCTLSSMLASATYWEVWGKITWWWRY